MALDLSDAEAMAAFIRRHTAEAVPALLPELRHYAASEITPIWEATESELERMGLAPPFWAFAWAGGQALARYAMDHRNAPIVAAFFGRICWGIRDV